MEEGGNRIIGKASIPSVVLECLAKRFRIFVTNHAWDIQKLIP